ncbi:MAG TPA: plastocyanin/azurin family copper-binding protein [Acidimicrobiales bacterium]|nr:plastocyanin/azurin family copper-binding protein [Acidimicrobiales bacterium]
MTSRSLRFLAAVVAVTSLVVAACSDSDSDRGDTGSSGGSGTGAAATVNLKPTTFDPADVAVKVGETVRWKWGGGVQHDVTGDGFESNLQSKGEFDHTFDTAGTFDYKCEVHPTTMKGTVTVEA